MKRQKIPDTKLWLPQPFLYCGPTAISAITGLDYYGQIRPAINRVRKRCPSAGVTGMRNYELVRALAQLGWLASPVVMVHDGTRERLAEKHLPFPKGVTLSQAMSAMHEAGGIRRSDIILVEITRHYVTVQSNVVVDNEAIDSLIRHPARRKQAGRAWQIVPIGQLQPQRIWRKEAV